MHLPVDALQHFGSLLIFLAAFLEAVPFVGVFIPGQTIVMLSGFLIKEELLRIFPIMTAAVIGAMISDFLGYVLGRKYGNQFIYKYGRYFLFTRAYFDKIKKIMDKHPGKTIIFGRFNSITRAFAPFLAGSSGIDWGRFIFFNVFGAIIWAGSCIGIGYIFGASYEIASQYIGRFIFFAVAITVILFCAYRFFNRKWHSFQSYHWYILGLNILSLAVFSKIAEDIYRHEWIIKWDIMIRQMISVYWGSIWDEIMIVITIIASPAVIIVLTMLLLIMLVCQKKYYFSVLFSLSLISGGILEVVLKFFIHRLRPTAALLHMAGYSFPSGYVTMATIFCVLLIYVFRNSVQSKVLRLLFVIVNLCLLLLIGFSRVYLGVIWFSDMIAGYALGIFWMTFLLLVLKMLISRLQNSKE
ncbi:hypothetical protein A2307_05000 [Candidatus Peregrinibacteria bacterium RIFOXYB2_FULL_33_20]|nr:MAG: hypothetical protein A2263_04335 [Candidatus Peregrinibacteria bacterium RIFOXYA2_FULL_33_21]OGJ51805.1 MAG: hypothetical protein A2307_05000 [Candidatus Peregrinibacteria bacterium RIFOXYB2_FULL_33_20]